jgi:hypothetical protein
MSNEKQQTAVEWLAEQMLHPEFHNPYIEQALEMEKGQIKDAFINGFCNAHDNEDKTLNADTIFYKTRYGGNK